MKRNTLASLVAAARSAHTLLMGIHWQSEAFIPAKALMNAAYDELRDALIAAHWGVDGATFVGEDRHGKRYLSIQGRLVATLDEEGWLSVTPYDEAERRFVAARANARAREASRQAARTACIRALVEGEGSWYYYPGQMGGYYYRNGFLTVAASGAMKAAVVELREDAGWAIQDELSAQ
ncbi:MAG: hypothetical protein WCV84_03070 [Patescibacteria group bacterium]